MKFPATERELKDNGYAARGKARCSGSMCQTWIHWFLTPKQKMMAFSKVQGSLYLLEPHIRACLNANDFIRNKGRAA